MPFTQRYSNIKNGGILFLGNTLGLSKAPNSLSAGTLVSIGVFVSTDNSLQVGNFPSGTTSNYLQNGSVSSLGMPSGSNNPTDNFFCSQINGSDGLIDTTGTFGSRNANAFAGTNTSACRQGWDITAVDVSALLATAETTAAVRFTTDGDLYVPNCLALQIDSKGARISVAKSADKTFALLGEDVTYTLVIKNTGDIDAKNVLLNDAVPTGLQFVLNSITLGGAPYAGSFPVNIGTLTPGQSVDVTFKAKAATLPAVNPVVNVARTDYSFDPFPGYTVSSFSDSNSAECFFVNTDVSVTKSVDKNYAEAGETLTYLSVVKNNSNVKIVNLFFKDQIPVGTSFVSGSVTVDGVAYPLYDPEAGFYLTELLPGQSAKVELDVKVN